MPGKRKRGKGDEELEEREEEYEDLAPEFWDEATICGKCCHGYINGPKKHKEGDGKVR